MGMWDSAVLTNSGLNLMAQWVDGAVLTIDKATAGEGTVNEAYLMGQTQLVAEKKQLSIVRQDRVANGVRIQMQCTNEGVAEEFTINQIGVWAHLDDGASVLLSIYQDDTGVLVPTNAEMPEYVFTFYAVLQVSNTGTLQVTIDASAVVTQGQLEAATAAIDAEIEKIVDGTTEVGHATNADHATSADTATNAGHAMSADTATNADEATNATYAQTASTADTAGYATTAKGDENGNDIAATYATKSELAAAGQFDPNGTYPNLTAGNATHAANADAATSAASATDAVNAQHAVKATQDEAGNNIQSTYATKAELNTKADQAALNGVINGTTPVAKATAADSATNATNATNDAQGRNIASTYALKSEVGAKKYLHLVYIPTESQANSNKFTGIVKIINDSSTAFTTTTLQQFLNGKAVEARGTFAEYKQPLDYIYEAFLIKGNANNFTVYGGLRAIGDPQYQPSGSSISNSVNIEYSRISSGFRDEVTEL